MCTFGSSDKNNIIFYPICLLPVIPIHGDLVYINHWSDKQRNRIWRVFLYLSKMLFFKYTVMAHLSAPLSHLRQQVTYRQHYTRRHCFFPLQKQCRPFLGGNYTCTFLGFSPYESPCTWGSAHLVKLILSKALYMSLMTATPLKHSILYT